MSVECSSAVGATRTIANNSNDNDTGTSDAQVFTLPIGLHYLVSPVVAAGANSQHVVFVLASPCKHGKEALKRASGQQASQEGPGSP